MQTTQTAVLRANCLCGLRLDMFAFYHKTLDFMQTTSCDWISLKWHSCSWGGAGPCLAGVGLSAPTTTGVPEASLQRTPRCSCSGKLSQWSPPGRGSPCCPRAASCVRVQVTLMALVTPSIRLILDASGYLLGILCQDPGEGAGHLKCPGSTSATESGLGQFGDSNVRVAVLVSKVCPIHPQMQETSQ